MANTALEFFETKSFEIRLRTTKLSTEYEELNYTKSRRKYEQLKEEILKYDYEYKFSKTNLTEVDVKLFLYDVLSQFFPDKRAIIKAILPLISENTSFASIEHDCVVHLDENDIVNNIFVYGYDDPVVIPSCAKEIIDGLIAPIEDKILSNIHYLHLPGITMEKIISKEAEKEFKQSIFQPMESIRLNHLKLILQNLDEVESYPKEIKNHILMQSALNYQQHQTFSYVISDIYATSLFEKYLEDNKQFLEIFNKFINGEYPLNILLDYYNISLKNQATVNTYQKKFQNTKKTFK